MTITRSSFKGEQRSLPAQLQNQDARDDDGPRFSQISKTPPGSVQPPVQHPAVDNPYHAPLTPLFGDREPTAPNANLPAPDILVQMQGAPAHGTRPTLKPRSGDELRQYAWRQATAEDDPYRRASYDAVEVLTQNEHAKAQQSAVSKGQTGGMRPPRARPKSTGAGKEVQVPTVSNPRLGGPAKLTSGGGGLGRTSGGR